MEQFKNEAVTISQAVNKFIAYYGRKYPLPSTQKCVTKLLCAR